MHSSRLTRQSPRAIVNLGLVGLTLTLGLAGCSGGGGSSSGGGSASPSVTTGPTGVQQSAVSAAHWQVALTALGQSYQPQAIAFDDTALMQWGGLVNAAWPGVQRLIQPLLLQALQQQLSSVAGQGGVVAITVKSASFDLGAPLAVRSARPEEVTLQLPAPPGSWRIEVELELQGTVRISGLRLPVVGDLTLSIEDIRLAVPVRFDLSDPAHPFPNGSGTPQVGMRLVLQSRSTFLDPLTQSLTSLLDPVIRVALQAGAVYAQTQLTGTLAGRGPAASYGTGGPGVTALAAPPALEALSVSVSDEIQRVHLPFGTLLAVKFDQPGFGNGQPIEYFGHGDSAIWTGHYVAGEAFRYDLTGDPRAKAGADRAFTGLEGCLDVSRFDGQLSRTIVPLSSPHYSAIQNGLDPSIGMVKGVPTGTMGDISRDQYLGAYLAFSQSYLRLPHLRDRARSLINRMTGYLVRNAWVAYRHDGVTPARGLFAQTPHVVWAVLKASNLVDRGQWGALHDQNSALPRISWFGAWASGQEVLSSYFKFNLQHVTVLVSVSTETDPATYREHAKTLEILRATIGHHQNAWFDGIYAASIPAVAPVTGPLVKAELEHYALRSRRSQPVDLTNDPTIQTVTRTVTAAGKPTRILEVATYPVPIEKRFYDTHFQWQRDPFRVKGSQTPDLQQSGNELPLPYWLGRSYGLFK